VADVELARIEALPYVAGLGPYLWNSTTDLDNDGVHEVIGVDSFPDPVWGDVTLVFGWNTPLPLRGSVVDAPWRFTNSDWVLNNIDNRAAGDWNHDGIDDLLLGANFHVANGRTDVLVAGPFGPPVAGQTVDVASRVYATIRWGSWWAGSTASVNGDYNGDGVDDLVIAAVGGLSGVADLNIWFGPISGEVDGLNPDVQIHSTEHPSNFPYIRFVPVNFGDIDGNGSDDLIIKAAYANDQEERVGATHIFLGPLRRGHHLADTDAWASIRWVHGFAGTGAGSTVVVPDVNGDGRDDLLVTVPYARSDHEPGGATVPRAPLPPGVTLVTPPVDSADTGSPSHGVEGAAMLFTNLRPGELRPEDAAIVLKGSQLHADLRSFAGFGDVDGDGLGDAALLATDLAGSPMQHVHVFRPCRDFGQMVTP
jgi:hypothetical protein